MHRQVGVVVLAIGHVRQCVHERHGAVVVLEAEGAHQRLAFFREFPTGHFGQQFAHARLGQPVFGAAAGNAVSLNEGDEVGHGGILGE
jgi:hypothetical protein